MESTTQDIISARYDELPPKLKALVVKPTLAPTIRIIAEKHHLPEDKIIALENEVMLVLLAFEEVGDFDEHIVAELLIPGSLATSIARDLDTMVFAEVLDELTTIYKERAEYEKTHPTVTPPQTFAHIPDPATPAPTAKPLTEAPRYTTQDPYREPLE